MGAITGKPDEQTVKETLEAYKAVGIDQYLIYPRSGLELEYMGEEWLQVCEWFCKHAKRLDMKIWLYDEYNWPSGSCKNRVPAENPDFQSRHYAVYKNPDGTFEWKVFHSPGWVDNYSFKAMERFIELTHKRYEKRLGPYMGSTVAGIFTDEPASPGPMKADGKPELVFRYFDGAEDEYRTRTGRALREDVQAYLNDPSKDEVWAVYYGLLGERFRKAFFDPIQAWCARVGLFSSGHMMSEDNTRSSCLCNGRPLLALKGLSLPGMDEIGTRLETNNIEWLTFAVAQHAIGRRGNGGLVEVFALGPGDMTQATQRQMIWMCALHKVDHYVLAVAPLDMRGNLEKNGYFNPLTRAQPWFPALRLLGDDARVAARYAAKPMRCDIAIRYPQTVSARLAMKKKSHPLLIPTLRCFSERQLTYDLYDEDEACDKPLVFAFDGTGLKEEKSGRAFATSEEAAAFAASVCPPAVRVETPDGQLAKGLLVRTYRDGSIAVLALGHRKPETLRLVRRGSAPTSFELSARGVRVWEASGSASGQEDADEKALPVLAATPETFALTLDRANTFRLAFGSNGVARLKLAQPIDGVRLAVRYWPQPYALTLDGKSVSADAPCDTLCQGFNELCRQTSPFRLEAGEHEVALAPGAKDGVYYFPVAWLTGPFAVEDRVVKPVPQKAGAGALWRQGLADYAGSVTYTAQTEVPKADGKLRLRLETGGLYTSVSLDGQPLGERAWAPFEWTVPSGLKGKRAELKITVWTSVEPLFGAIQAPGSMWSKKLCGASQHAAPSEVGLIAPPQWLKED